jgi:hypothetical protein
MVAAREEFGRAMVDLLNTGADQLRLAGTDEESAKLLALQAHQQLAATSLSLASRTETSVSGCSARGSGWSAAFVLD